MRNLSRHILLLFIAAFAAVCYADDSKNSLQEERTEMASVIQLPDFSIENTDCSNCILPSQNSYTSGLRPQLSVSKRVNGSCKNNTEYIKAGKFVYAGTRTFVNYTIHFISVPFAKSFHKLITFGKLTI